MSNNILLDTLPETVTVDGRDYFLDTDFRTCIILEMILHDSSIDNQQKIHSIIELFYTDQIPDNPASAIEAILDFYKEGIGKSKKPTKARMNGNVQIKPKMIYSFEYDAPYIFGAFLTQYKIDLNEIEYLHWWKFQALFKSLDSSNKIVEIMSYRATDLSQIENKRERERIARLKSIYDLPQNLTSEEKIAMAGAAFGGGFA